MSTNKKKASDTAAIADDVPTEELAALTEAEIAAMEAQEGLEADASSQGIELEQLRRKNAEMTELLTRRDEELAALRSELAAKTSELAAKTLTDEEAAGRPEASADEAPPCELHQPVFDTGETRKLVGHGEHASCEFAIGPGRMRLGSSADNDIRIESGFVSGHHAQILSSSNETILRDMNSTNGTYVNSRKIGRCALHDGDSITLGNVSFTFVRRKPVVSDDDPIARRPELEHGARPDRGHWR